MRSRWRGHCSVASAWRASFRRGDTLVSTRPSVCPVPSERALGVVGPSERALAVVVPSLCFSLLSALCEGVSFCCPLSGLSVALAAFLLELLVSRLFLHKNLPIIGHRGKHRESAGRHAAHKTQAKGGCKCKCLHHHIYKSLGCRHEPESADAAKHAVLS